MWNFETKPARELYQKFAAKGVGEVHLSPNLEKQIKYVDPSVPRRRGIGGAYNKAEFYKNKVNVLNVERHPSMHGIEKKHRDGSFVSLVFSIYLRQFIFVRKKIFKFC